MTPEGAGPDRSLPSISVALATFNGERFLRDQLESIALQQFPPAELIACDDCSDDGTVAMLEEFSRNVPFPVRIHVNGRAVGSTKNFEQAISRCGSDIIALADQDDVWEPGKLTAVGRAFDARPEVGMVFSDAEVVDEEGQTLGYTLWESRAIPVGTGVRARIREGGLFSVLLKSNVVTGATMAFRSGLKSLVLPIPERWMHDAWIALLASATGAVEPIPERLVRYRQHTGQQIGGRRMTIREQARWGASVGARSFEQVLRNLEDAMERLTLAGGGRGLAAADGLRAKRRHFEARLRMKRAPWRRWYLAPREFFLGRYRRYDLGWKSLGQDLVFLSHAAVAGEGGPPLWGSRV